jgi:hypothetical protein
MRNAGTIANTQVRWTVTDLELLTERGWTGTPWDYNSTIFITFRTDGGGQMVFAYGQMIYAIVPFRYERTGEGELTITHEARADEPYKPGFTPTPQDVPKVLRYSIEPKHGRGAVDTLLRMEEQAVLHQFEYEWRLKLSDSPFPDSLKLPDIRVFSPGASEHSPPREYFRMTSLAMRTHTAAAVEELEENEDEEMPEAGRFVRWLRHIFRQR